MAPQNAQRKRDAAATRASILASARRSFAAAGYDGAGVREIAQAAGITAMLVNRYFGSKEQLFAEVLATIYSEPQILRESVLVSHARARDLAHALVDQTAEKGSRLEGFLILLKSASNERAAAMCRDQIERHQQRDLAAAITADHAAQRAAVALALVAGFQLMRQMVGMEALINSQPEVLAAILAPALSAIIDA